MLPDVDLVIVFRATSKTTLSKQQIREDARRGEQQYSRLIDTLSYAGLRAVGRRGESLGHLLIFVSCPKVHVSNLVKRERYSDFLYGLPTTKLPSETINLDSQPLSPAERIRLVHDFITSTPADGGLGIIPGSADWDLVDSVMALHDREFNDLWIRAWSARHIASVQLTKIREQFGDSVALYFAFLSGYTRALIFPAVLGLLFYFFGSAYSPLYSFLLMLWSVVFVEWWRIRERILSVRFGTRGSFRVERRRAQYTPGFPWWKRELRMVATIPVILMFASILAALLTAIFIFEAFVTQLYTGPGQKLITFTPTILFVLLVPSLLAVYQSLAKRATNWENHTHQSTHTASLTLKTFALSAVVAYLGLALSAFIYVPFGEGLMQVVQVWLFNGVGEHAAQDITVQSNKTVTGIDMGKSKIWEMDTSNARNKINPGRLRDQMFAYTVTNQVVNTFMEVGLPFILRALRSVKQNRSSTGNGSPGGKKKKVVFEDEKERGGQEEREFLERVRSEVALPEYETFQDYSEMVTQFGYVALWSTIWPLAPVMALLNNFLELRSDAFKITVHNRRPIPTRTDTIGPWLEALTFLTWLSALTNSTLVYLFCPRSHSQCLTETPIDKIHKQFFEGSQGDGATRELVASALVIALAASHGYLLLRVIVRHVLERMVWKGSREFVDGEKAEREVEKKFLQGIQLEKKGDEATDDNIDGERKELSVNEDLFWGHDEGVEEIQRILKEA